MNGCDPALTSLETLGEVVAVATLPERLREILGVRARRGAVPVGRASMT